MKKNEIHELEEIRKERKLSKEAEKTIKSKIVSNFAICLSIVILMMAFAITGNYLEKEFTMHIYNASAVAFLICSIVIFEVAYKKDSGNIALYGVETLVVSIFTLFAPYIFLKYDYHLICYGAIAVVTLYYIIKIIRISCVEKGKFQYEKSDFSQIIKKESKDEEAVKEQENILKQMKELRKQEKAKAEAEESSNEEVLEDIKKAVEKKKAINKKKIKDNSEAAVKAKKKTNVSAKVENKDKVEEKKSTRGRKKKVIEEVKEDLTETPKTKKSTSSKATVAKKTSTAKKETTTRKPRTATKTSTTKKTSKKKTNI